MLMDEYNYEEDIKVKKEEAFEDGKAEQIVKIYVS